MKSSKLLLSFESVSLLIIFLFVYRMTILGKKGYSLSAGQYFDIKIEYVDITEKEFNARMASFLQTLIVQFEESHRLEKEIMSQPNSLKFNE